MIKCLHQGSHGDGLPHKWHYNITFIYFSGCSLDKIELNVDSNEILDRLSHSSHVLNPVHSEYFKGNYLQCFG